MTATQTTAGTSPRPRPPQVFAFLFCSVDGFIEDAEHRLDWNTNDPELFVWNQRQARQAPHIGAVLLGRRTYDHFADFWTTPEAAEQFPEIAAFMHEAPKTVVTTRPDSLPAWHGARPADGADLPGVVAELHAEHDGDIAVFGSSELAARLLEQGLLDELRILISPVLLGHGTGLFHGLGARVRLQAGPATMFPSGNALLTYTPQAPERADAA